MNSNLKQFLTSPTQSYSQEISQGKALAKVSENRALKLFQQASKYVPAYQDFLKKNRINPSTIKTISDFKKVPPVTKENYILQYDLASRCLHSDPAHTHAFSASSGSTGHPLFWPRHLEQEIEGAQMHELLLSQVFQVHQNKTLFINAFGLGNWIAGMFTHSCVYLAALHGHPYTIATPGYNQEEVFKVIQAYSPHFDQTILACHPPIIKIMVESGIQQGIDWSQLNIKFWGAGEGFSENWRDYLLSLVGQTDPLTSIINVYGSADAGLMAFETPLSIAIHREANTNHELNRRLFASERKPYLYQFDPRLRYLEAIDNQIAITMPAAMPLIRYNIHDHGNIIDYRIALQVMEEFTPDFLKDLKSSKVDIKQWQLPFVYIFGRDEFMTTLFGVNIYPENIKAVLDLQALQPYLTGRFVTQKKIDTNQDQYLLLRLELKPKVKPTKKLEALVTKSFITTLRQINSEYNQVEQKFTQKMHPRLKLLPFGDKTYFPPGITKKMG